MYSLQVPSVHPGSRFHPHFEPFSSADGSIQHLRPLGSMVTDPARVGPIAEKVCGKKIARSDARNENGRATTEVRDKNATNPVLDRHCFTHSQPHSLESSRRRSLPTERKDRERRRTNPSAQLKLGHPPPSSRNRLTSKPEFSVSNRYRCIRSALHSARSCCPTRSHTPRADLQPP